VIEITVGIQVGDIMEVKSHILDRLARTEGSLNICACLKISGFYTDVRVAAAGLVVAVIQHFVQVAIQFKGDTFAKFVDIDHACVFLVEDPAPAGCEMTTAMQSEAAGLYYRSLKNGD
jgi:hypothetical protein